MKRFGANKCVCMDMHCFFAHLMISCAIQYIKIGELHCNCQLDISLLLEIMDS